MPLPQQKFIIFLHIQKTGGLTLQRVLRRKLGDSLLIRLYKRLKGKQPAMPVGESAKLKRMKDRYFAGHCCVGIHKNLPQPYTYITLLRDPVNRIVSLYHYSLNTPGAHYHQCAISKTLEAFALDTHLFELDNGQVRFLAGGAEDCFINQTPIGKCDAQLLEQAKRNINQYFSFVGLTEYFDQSLLMLSKLMGWQHCFYLRLNERKSRRIFVAEELKLQISQKNALDVQLYKYVEQRFLEEAARHNISEADVDNFRRVNGLINFALGFAYSTYENLKTIKKRPSLK